MQLLLACLAIRPAPDAIREACGREIDWTRLLELASRHGVGPLLYNRLNAICPGSVPGPELETLQRWYRNNLRRNLFLIGELVKILERFKSRAIPVIAYKGPVLASYYENLGLRQFSDLDLLVRGEDVQRADELLRSDGFHQSLFKPCPQEERALPFARTFHFEMSYRSEDSATWLDLHWALMPGFFALPKTVQSIWERVQPAMVAGQPIPTLAPEDTLLFLCVHGTKHIWERLGWLRDVAAFVAAHGDLNWESVFQRAAQLRTRRALSLGLRLASELLGAELPDSVAGRIANDPRTEALVAAIRKQLFVDPGLHSGVFSSCGFYMRSREDVSDAARCCVERIFQPTMAEWESIPLPRALYSLYYLLRPMRLIGKHAFGE